ncbi:acyltransferase [Pseudorhodoferax sp. LjRoot39]|uniref:acyltransferase family protein n=1 Tax=Pseudorhodoferax sp. LjRoot39 TaxID=3342328 RepID=UPI003ECE286D
MNTMPSATMRRFSLRQLVFGSKTLHETIESHDNNYTLVRLVLAASVIYFHSFALTGATGHVDPILELLWPVTDVGGLAVKLFFLLSGLFVTQSLHKNPDVLGFVLKRFLRIWPGYFVCLLVTAILAVIVTGQDARWYYLKSQGLYDYVLRNSIFKLTWQVDGLLATNRLPTINGPIHTLPMEAKMYALLACLGAAGILRTSGRIAATGIAALALALLLDALGGFPNGFFDADWSLGAGLMFLTGVVLYGVSAWLKPALWQGMALLPALVWGSGVVYFIAFYAFAIWLMLMLGQAEALGRLLRPHQDWSYGIYIYGWPSQQIVLALVSQTLHPHVLSALALGLATVFAAWSWRLVEKPAIDLGRQFDGTPLPRAPFRHRTLLVVLTGLVVFCVAARSIAHKWAVGPERPMAAKITDFGPHDTRAGTAVNLQPDGHSAIWIRFEGRPPAGAVIVMDGHRLDSQLAAGVATARVGAGLLALPGEKKIYLEYRSTAGVERSNEVSLWVRP